MEKDNARKALGLPIMSELTNEELNKELEIAIDNTLNGCTFIPRYDPAQTRRISLEKTRDEQYEDIHNEFRLRRIDSISHFTRDGEIITKDCDTLVEQNELEPIELVFSQNSLNKRDPNYDPDNDLENTVVVYDSEELDKDKGFSWKVEFKMPFNLMPPFPAGIGFSNLEACKRELAERGNAILHLKSDFRIKKINHKGNKYLYVSFGLSIPTLLLTMAACMDAKDKEEEVRIIDEAAHKLLPLNDKAFNKMLNFVGRGYVDSESIATIGYNALILPLIALSMNPKINKQELNDDGTISTEFENSDISITETYWLLLRKMDIENKYWIKKHDAYRINKYSRNYIYPRYKTKRK